MATPLVFLGTRHPSGTSVIPDDKDMVRYYIEAFADGTRFEVSIKPWKKSRSRGRKGEEGNQLGFFFGTVVKIWMEQIDFTIHKNESYYNIMNLFSYELVTSPKGKPLKKLIHVDDQMTTEQMTKLISDCQIYAAEQDVFIPDPDPAKSKRNLARFMAQRKG